MASFQRILTLMSDYDFQEIETRWQKTWAESGAFEVAEDPKRPKFYCLEMLPYPSGDIHVGHVRNYCITDVISRCKTMRGFERDAPDRLGRARAAGRERRDQAGDPPREVDARRTSRR